VVEDPAVSRKHFELVASENSYKWKDLGSTNGTFINGQKMLSGELHPGDTIQIGRTVFHFEIEKTEELTPHVPEKTGEIDDEPSIVARSFLSMDETHIPAAKERRATLLYETLCKVIT
jgi:pSer/pThr/pTyr-binding forkhead associated (FHA) protein